jgi:hypothetical protein
VAAQLAAHCQRAGALDRAVSWVRARRGDGPAAPGQRGGVRLLERALDLLESLAPSDEWQARELAVLAALPAPVAATLAAGPLVRSSGRAAG